MPHRFRSALAALLLAIPTLLLPGVPEGHAASIVSGNPQASQPLGTLPDAVLLDQGTGCPTNVVPCTTSQTPSLRVGQPFQGTVAPTPPFKYQLWWDTSLAGTPKLKVYDGSTWNLVATLDTSAHVWTPTFPNAVAVTVDSNAALKAVPVGRYTTISRSGVLVAGDSPAVIFVWDPLATCTDDIGSCVAPNSGSGRWVVSLPGGGMLSSATFGAVCDGVANDQPPLQKWLDAVIRLKATAWLQESANGCDVKQSGANPYTLVATSPIQIRGQRGKSTIVPDAALGAGVDIIAFFGAPTGDYIQTVVSGIMIGNPSAGQSPGRHRLYFDTQAAGAAFQAPIVENVYLQSSSAGGFAVAHVNNNAVNPSGGLRGAIFGRGSYFGGGVSLDGSGDSIDIVEGTFRSGDGGISNVNPCVYARLSPDSANLKIHSNNMSCANGQVIVDRGQVVDIFDNEMEQAVANNATNKALIDLRGTAAALLNPRVLHNVLIVTAAGAAGNPVNLRVGNAAGTVFDSNSFNVSGIWTPVVITASAVDTQVGCVNTFNANGAGGISDLGTGSLGCGLTGAALVSPTLSSGGGGAFTAAAGSLYYNVRGHWVDLSLTITITTNGAAATSVIATLPFTPSVNTTLACEQNPSGKGGSGLISIVGGAFVTIRFADGTYPGGDATVITCSGAMGKA